MLNDLTALYTPLDIEYQQEYSGPYEDLSFRCDEVEIIASLKDGLVTGFGRPMVSWGSPELLEYHIQRIYDTCKNIRYMDFLEDGELSIVSKFLLKKGYKARPYYTQIIDWCSELEYLHKNLRKSYKSLVNKTDGLKKCSVSEYRDCHYKYHGHTRSDITWDIQEKMDTVCYIQEDTGAMFYREDDISYYASACGENNHACVWACLKELYENWFEHGFVEMGEQVFYGDEKQMNISKFKRGFGGRTYTRLILEV